jgi:hypothetical protein
MGRLQAALLAWLMGTFDLASTGALEVFVVMRVLKAPETVLL